MAPKTGILVERQNLGDWLKITVPYTTSEKMQAVLLTESGETLRTVLLTSGANAIDLSNIKRGVFHVKIETPIETILKIIDLNLL
jgi:hypothetical protein